MMAAAAAGTGSSAAASSMCRSFGHLGSVVCVSCAQSGEWSVGVRIGEMENG